MRPRKGEIICRVVSGGLPGGGDSENSLDRWAERLSRDKTGKVCGGFPGNLSKGTERDSPIKQGRMGAKEAWGSTRLAATLFFASMSLSYPSSRLPIVEKRKTLD